RSNPNLTRAGQRTGWTGGYGGAAGCHMGPRIIAKGTRPTNPHLSVPADGRCTAAQPVREGDLRLGGERAFAMLAARSATACFADAATGKPQDRRGQNQADVR